MSIGFRRSKEKEIEETLPRAVQPTMLPRITAPAVEDDIPWVEDDRGVDAPWVEDTSRDDIPWVEDAGTVEGMSPVEKYRKISELYKIEKARGPLSTAFRALVSNETTVSSNYILYQLAQKDLIRELSAMGALDLTPEVQEFIDKAGDDDFRIYPESSYNGYIHPSSKIIERGETAPYLEYTPPVGKGKLAVGGTLKTVDPDRINEQLWDTPLILEITTDRETKQTRQLFTRKVKGEKVIGRTVELIKVPLTFREIDKLMEEPAPDSTISRKQALREASLEIAREAIQGRKILIQKQLADGGVDIEEATMTTLSKTVLPPGYEDTGLHRAVSLGMSFLIPEPVDVVGGFLATDMVEYGIKSFWASPFGKPLFNTLNHIPPTRWGMRFMGWMPYDLQKGKWTHLGAKADVTVSKKQIHDMGRRLWGDLITEARKSGKKWNVRYQDKIYNNYIEWLSAGGDTFFQQWRRQGKNFQDFVNDVPLMARKLGTTPEDLKKYFTFLDDRDLMRTFERGGRLQIELDKQMAAAADEMIEKIGTTNNPSNMGVILRDGTALRIHTGEHAKKLGVLSFVDSDNIVPSALNTSGGVRTTTIYGVAEIEVPRTGITQAQLDQLQKVVARVKKDAEALGNVASIGATTLDEGVVLGGKKSTGMVPTHYALVNPTKKTVDEFFKPALVKEFPLNPVQFENTLKDIHAIVEASEQFKLLVGAIDESHIQKYLDEGMEYIPHRWYGQDVDPGAAFRKTDKRLASGKRRIHLTLDNFEDALVQSGDSPQYSIVRTVLEDAEESTNEFLRVLLETKLEDAGVYCKVIGSPGIKSEKVARRVVELNKRFLDPDYGKITDYVATANEVLSAANTNRIKTLLNEGATEIRIISPEKVDLSAIRARKHIWNRGWDTYFPRSRMKIFSRNVQREMAEKLAKGEITEELAKKAKSLIDEIGVEVAVDNADLVKVLTTLQDDVLKEAAPKSVLSVSKKVPMNFVSEDMAKYIRSEIRTVLDPDVSVGLRVLSRLERPFMSAVTVWNPNFWRKYVMTDGWQMYAGGVAAPMIPARVSQGALIMTGKGKTSVNGVKIANRVMLDAMERSGVRRHIRTLMSNNRYNFISQFATDAYSGRPFLNATREINDRVSKLLTSVDDSCRGGLFINRMDDLAWERGLKTQDEILSLADECAQWTWRFMFNYDDLPMALKKARAFVPFLSWQRHIIPAVLRFAFDTKKMKQLAKGHMNIQSMIGLPDTALQSEYIDRSVSPKWEVGGTLFRLNLNLPYEQLLNFENAQKTFEGMFSLISPIIQAPLAMFMDRQLFPYVGKYAHEKVPMPISMGWAFKGMWANPTFQKATGMSFNMVRDEDDQMTEAYLTVDKKFYDIYHMFVPFAIPVDENTKNLKYFVPLREIEDKWDTDQLARLGSGISEKEAAGGIVSREIAGKKKLKYHQTRPGLLVREVDVNVMMMKELNGYKASMNELQRAIDGYIQIGKRYDELVVDDAVHINEVYFNFWQKYERIRDYEQEYPEQFKEMVNGLMRKGEELQRMAENILPIENGVVFKP